MDSFCLEEWEIWYTFSTYLKASINNLEAAAELLVESEIADCCITSSGETHCRTDNGVVSGKTILELSGDLKKVSAEFKGNSAEVAGFTGYAHEAWLIGIQFLYGEARQISQGRELPTPHLRAFLQPISLVKEEVRISRLYPVIVLYQSGVLLVELRMIAPNNSVEISDFIRDYVNIQQYDYDFAIVPTAISAFAPEAYHYYSNLKANIFQRLDLLQKKRKQKSALQALSRSVESDDFEFKVAPLFSTEGKETITSIAQTLFTIVGFIAKCPISSIGFLIEGVPKLPEIGEYWIGRPHIHLIRHSNQLESSSENEELNKNFFGQILARVPEGNSDFSVYLPLDSRRSEDYAAYITSAATLWVWSKSGLESQEQLVNINRGHLIYEHQVQVELLEYGFILYKSLVEKSKELNEYPAILAIRRDLSELKSKMIETTPYGEVRDLLSKGWEQMNLEAMQSQISENLSILENELKFIESKQGDNFRVYLTILGLIASASFAKSIVSPFWNALSLWLPSNENWAELFLAGVSAMLIILIVLFLKLFIYR
ncbi:hypothetical protein KBY84_08580 [Cyanobium sp. N.Huapi 1H5]|uniref:hypothetical protein n=1 Tax=Cyanobium sp. N.Huapi 1H5 TaxID=2823719 RepID=UPI0020CD557C|nr:hypothetical protein [Cyanobium sp. N.Huapi 1H5]MCP9837550.1 hypothetical protein [Cyanobium sp. N.Huapi 1H5]